jgi:chemotaxis protein CheD
VTQEQPFSRHPAVDGSEQETIRINPGGFYVSRGGSETIVTVLGSCVAACIRDPITQVGGMNHFMLPASDSGQWGAASASLRFGNFAMERLINDILRQGGRRRHLEIKVFGGARMMGNGSSIGLQNAAFVETYLRKESLPIAAHDLRGDHARRIHYQPLTGRVRVLTMPREEVSILRDELSYAAQLTARPDSGSIELFD